MIRLISMAALAMGALLLILAAVIFIKNGLIHVWRDLKTSQRAQMEFSAESVATDLYYNEILKKRREEKPEGPAREGFQKNVRRIATDDSAILFEQKQQESTAPLYEEGAGTAHPAPESSATGTDMLKGADTAFTPAVRKKADDRTAPLQAVPQRQENAVKEGKTDILEVCVGKTDVLEDFREKTDILEDYMEKTGVLEELMEKTDVLEDIIRQIESKTDVLEDLKVKEPTVRGTDILYENLRNR